MQSLSYTDHSKQSYQFHNINFFHVHSQPLTLFFSFRRFHAKLFSSLLPIPSPTRVAKSWGRQRKGIEIAFLPNFKTKIESAPNGDITKDNWTLSMLLLLSGIAYEIQLDMIRGFCVICHAIRSPLVSKSL